MKIEGILKFNNKSTLSVINVYKKKINKEEYNNKYMNNKIEI